jgi:hypothetical protein
MFNQLMAFFRFLLTDPQSSVSHTRDRKALAVFSLVSPAPRIMILHPSRSPKICSAKSTAFLKKSIQELASRLCASRKFVSTLDLAKNLRFANDHRF